MPLAHAGTAADGRLHYAVDYSDLNLTRLEGAAALYHRLERAADRVCAPLDQKGVRSVQLHRACLRSALADAIADVNQPLLTAYHESKTGQYTATTAQASTRP